MHISAQCLATETIFAIYATLHCMLDAIRIFIAVAEGGSLSAIARSRDVAVSSISRNLDVLELQLGTKLLRRGSRPVLLTDAGDMFLPQARRLVADLDDAKRELSELDSNPRGLLTLTAPAAFSRRHVVPAIASFRQRYPLIHIDLHASDVLVDLSAERMDIAIRIGVLADSDLVATRLAPLHRLVCASPAYLERRGRPVSPADLIQHDCLTVTSSPVPAGWWCFPGVNRGSALPVHGPLRTNDTESLLQAAIAGLGIVHLASWLTSEAIASSQLLPLLASALPTSQKSGSAIYAVRLPGRSHTAKASLFVDHLKDCFGSPAYWDRALLPP